MNAALIVAAGQGVRMGGNKRKQYLTLAGRPTLMHTLKAFDAIPSIERLIVVVPEQDKAYCHQQIITPSAMDIPVDLVAGGERRQDSVFNGLQTIHPNDGIVLIHDGVRPLVTETLIKACIQGAQRWQACIPVIQVTDTLKRIDPQGKILRTLPRKDLRLAQTPQAFDLSLIRKAHAEALRNGWQATDDASLVEQMGVEIHTIEGSRDNIKITTPQDLAWAEFLLQQRSRSGEDASI